MSEQLRTMLHEVADGHPEFPLAGDPWRRGRRIRLARRVAGVAGVAVTVTAVVTGTVLLTTPDLTSTPEPAQEDSVEPTLPDTLHEVPLNIPDITDDPLGEPAAVVYSGRVRTGLFSDPETRPLVVGAETGEVRAVRDAGMIDNAVLSPDGTMLATAASWSITGLDNEPDLDPPSILLVNLVTGESDRHTLPDHGLGGGVETITWGADPSVLAITVIKTTNVTEDGTGGEGQEVYGHLDTTTSEWREDSTGDVAATSRDGRKRVVGDRDSSGYTVRDEGSSTAVAVDLDAIFGVAFSPDGQQIAAVDKPGSGHTESDPYLLEIFDAASGERVGHIELGEYSVARLLGWGEHGVLVQSVRTNEGVGGQASTVRTIVERIDTTDPDYPGRSRVLLDETNSWQVGIPAASLDAPTREAEPPDAGFDWAAWVPDPYLLIMFGGVGAALLIEFLRRRARSARG